ncbi:S8 family serine peptidase [Candidatus Woesearchaeota archaeon]|nr:S8 family serine peptidase [Candidatus Woesearchaeota archaeon]
MKGKQTNKSKIITALLVLTILILTSCTTQYLEMQNMDIEFEQEDTQQNNQQQTNQATNPTNTQNHEYATSETLKISLATLKDFYSVGEQIKLTDPPEKGLTGDSVSDFETPKYSGYIVEFEEEPLAKEYSRLKKLAKENENSFLEENIEDRLENYKLDLEEKHEQTKSEILQKTNNEIKSSYTKVFNGISLDLLPSEIQEIKNIEGVKRIYPDYEVTAFLMDSIPLINADDVWELDENLNPCLEEENCLTGKDVIIGIIDTGVDYTHRDLGSCTTEEFLDETCEKVVGGYDFVNDDGDPIDDQGHGTHVASTAAGNGVLKGVAPDAKIYAYKVLNSLGGGSLGNVISAIERSLDPNEDGDFSDKLDVISLSLGGSGNPDDPMSSAIDNVVDAGVVAVIASGNSGPNERSIMSPGNARKAITVGATYKKNYDGSYWDFNPRVDQVTSFSSRGPVLWENEEGNIMALIKPDIVAPGAIICAARYDSIFPPGENEYYYPCLDEDHVQLAGTSMATPIISGAVALLKQAHPTWNAFDMKGSLRNNAVSLNQIRTIQGSGRIDIFESLLNTNDESALAFLDQFPYFSEGILEVRGTAKGNFDSYKVTYSKESSLSGPKLICEGTEEIIEGVLCPEFDTTRLMDGDYSLQINIYKENQIVSNDMNIFSINNLEIISPKEPGVYRFGETIPIFLNILNPYYELSSFEVFSMDNSQIINAVGITQINKTFFSWDTSLLDQEGFYIINFNFNFFGETFTESTPILFISSSLKEGWPKELDWQGGTFGGNSQDSLMLFKDKTFLSFIPNNNRNSFSFYTFGNESVFIKSSENNLEVTSTTEDFRVLDNTEQNFDFYYWPGKVEPVIEDLEGDGSKEILFYYAGNPLKVYAFKEDGSRLEGFPIEVDVYSPPGSNGGLPGGNIGPPSVIDFNNDGLKEIVVNGIYNLFVYDLSGSLIRKIPLEISSQPNSLIVLKDLNGDGNIEILKVYDSFEFEGVPESALRLAVLDLDGNFLPGWPKIVYNKQFGNGSFSCGILGGYETSSLIANLDDDPEYEVVVPSTRNVFDEGVFTLENWHCEGRIFAFNFDGSLVEGFPVNVNGFALEPGVIGDVDSDGYDEIIFYTNKMNRPNVFGNGVYVLEENGSIKTGWPQFVSSGHLSSLSLFKQRDYLNISIKKGFWNYILDRNGNVVFSGGEPVKSVPVLFGKIENNIYGFIGKYFTFRGLSLIYLSNFSDSSIEKKIVYPEISMYSVFDLEGDNFNELISSSVNWNIRKTFIQVFNLDSPFRDVEMDWPMYQHDSQHTGCYNCEDISVPLGNPRPQSKIVNSGDVDVRGILTLALQNKIENHWRNIRIVTNEKVNISANNLIKLDIGKYYGWNLKNVSVESPGKYRVYGSFQYDEVFIEDSWEFEVLETSN